MDCSNYFAEFLPFCLQKKMHHVWNSILQCIEVIFPNYNMIRERKT